MELARYRCVKCPRVGTARELETHLAERHYGFYPHHCRTCGLRTHDTAAIYEQCVPLKHKVVFWEVREEEQEGLLAVDFEACVRKPVVASPPPPMAGGSNIAEQLVDSGESGSVDGRSSYPDGEPPCLDEESPAMRGRKACFKRGRDLPVHTAMTCHYTDCGQEVAIRGKQSIIDLQKRHVQERHLKELAAGIRCPVTGCKKAEPSAVGVRVCREANFPPSRILMVLGVDELASYRAMQKRMKDASAELIPICFPPGAVSRDMETARKTTRCAKCGKSIDAYLISVLLTQKAHIEKEHLVGFDAKCPVQGCTTGSNISHLQALAQHIGKRHGGMARLSAEESAACHAHRETVKEAIDKLLPECFPGDDKE